MQKLSKNPKQFFAFSSFLLILLAVFTGAIQAFFSSDMNDKISQMVIAEDLIQDLRLQNLELIHSAELAVYHFSTAAENVYYRELDDVNASISKLSKASLEINSTEFGSFIQSKLRFESRNENILEAMRQGRFNQAKGLAQSLEYEKDRTQFIKTADTFLEKFENFAHESLNKQVSHARFLFYISLLSIFLTTAFVIWVRGILEKWADLQDEVQSALEREKARIKLELEASQSQLIQSAKLASLGEMSAGIAHEINNPLAIISSVSLLGSKILSENKVVSVSQHVKLAQYYSQITQTCERISKIIMGLLAFSRQDQKDPMRFIEWSQICSATLLLVKDRAKKIAIKLSFSEHLYQYSVDCREAQIVQVLTNLIGNSIDAVSQLESQPWIEVSSEWRNDLFYVSVTDSGNGIPVQIAEKMLDPFFTTKPVGKGTGLGLSISKSIIESHGGKLEYDPTYPQTRFNLIFPSIKISKIKSREAA